VQREHIPESPGRSVADLKLRRLIATRHTAKTTDQRVEVVVFRAIDAPEIGNDPVPRLSGLVALGLDDLQVTPTTTFVDAHEHTYKICRESQHCNANDKYDV